MEFIPIDPASWSRIQTFSYFSRMAPTGYSLTVELDVTVLRRVLKAHGLKFYPVYLWLVTKNLNANPAFCLAKQGGTAGILRYTDAPVCCFPQGRSHILHDVDGI